MSPLSIKPFSVPAATLHDLRKMGVREVMCWYCRHLVGVYVATSIDSDGKVACTPCYQDVFREAPKQGIAREAPSFPIFDDEDVDDDDEEIDFEFDQSFSMINEGGRSDEKVDLDSLSGEEWRAEVARREGVAPRNAPWWMVEATARSAMARIDHPFMGDRDYCQQIVAEIVGGFEICGEEAELHPDWNEEG